MKTYAELGAAIGGLVQRKNVAYGDSITKTGEFLRLLYPDGLRPDQYDDVALQVRMFDKQMRIATDRDALGESPYEDMAGYGILGAHMQWQKKEIGACPGNANGAVTQSESGPQGSAASNVKNETAPSTPATPEPAHSPQPDGCSSPLASSTAPAAPVPASASVADQRVVLSDRQARLLRLVESHSLLSYRNAIYLLHAIGLGCDGTLGDLEYLVREGLLSQVDGRYGLTIDGLREYMRVGRYL